MLYVHNVRSFILLEKLIMVFMKCHTPCNKGVWLALLEIMASATQNIEYTTLSKLAPRLTAMLSEDSQSISEKLLAKGLIPPSLHSSVSKSDGEDRASEMVHAITKKVMNFRSNFHKFLRVLRESGPWYEETVEEIEREYEALKQVSNTYCPIVASFSPFCMIHKVIIEFKALC